MPLRATAGNLISNSFSCRVNSLWLILEDASLVLSRGELTHAQQKSLSSILDGANQTLVDLQSLLHKYIRIETSPTNVTDRARQAWKKLRFEPDDVRDLRDRLTSHVVLLHAFNDSITR